MAGTEQLPNQIYLVGGQTTGLTNLEVMEETKGFEEDGEDYFKPAGQWKARINYSRRRTISVQCDALTGATPHTYLGGSVTIGGVAYHIRDARIVKTRGPQRVELDLIELTDRLAPA
jgi:hypothetical protein